MNAPAPLPPSAVDTTAQDLQHLRLLSIFHYIVAAITGLFALFPLLHLAVGIGLVSGHLGETDPEASYAGWLFIIIAVLFIVSGLILAGFIAYAGRCLSQRRRHMLCLVVAGLECTLMPFGTVLGVFTLIVLTKPQIKALFAPA